jgi:hypothetical protein
MKLRFHEKIQATGRSILMNVFFKGLVLITILFKAPELLSQSTEAKNCRLKFHLYLDPSLHPTKEDHELWQEKLTAWVSDQLSHFQFEENVPVKSLFDLNAENEFRFIMRLSKTQLGCSEKNCLKSWIKLKIPHHKKNEYLSIRDIGYINNVDEILNGLASQLKLFELACHKYLNNS